MSVPYGDLLRISTGKFLDCHKLTAMARKAQTFLDSGGTRTLILGIALSSWVDSEHP